ncbi:hypothetical protein [Prochlorococcus sp. MIT 1314]|uniref:hypothetical protein n=1 Tax=Prochlorococcus sp. MIT 1314 TaxID=3096220 RepID=UPI002A759421|nr:hypothetical protein [Prochlorococcus sp. MIT 1314]
MKHVDIFIIGSGSIALRHYRICEEMSLNVHIFSPSKNRKEWLEENQFRVSHPEEVTCEIGIVCSSASRHLVDINLLGNIAKLIIVEKPLFPYQLIYKKISCIHSEKIIVGFNKRFESGIQEMKKISILENSEIDSITMKCLSDLNNWRRKDLRKLSESTSLQLRKGGGVLNELSHEIDLCEFLGGKIQEQIGYKWKQKFKNFDVEDSALLINKQTEKNFISSVFISFASSLESRVSEIRFKNGTNLIYDHLSQKLKRFYKGSLKSSDLFLEERNKSFKRQIKAALEYGVKYKYFCNYERGLYYAVLSKEILWLQ